MDARAKQATFQTVFSLGANFFFQGKYSKAKTIFHGLSEVYPDNPDSFIALGEILLAQEKWERASGYFVALRKKFGDLDRILLGSAHTCIMAGNYEEAFALVKPIIDQAVLSSKKTYSMAKAILALNKLNQQ